MDEQVEKQCKPVKRKWRYSQNNIINANTNKIRVPHNSRNYFHYIPCLYA